MTVGRELSDRRAKCPATHAVDKAGCLMTLSFGKVQTGTALTDLSTL